MNNIESLKDALKDVYSYKVKKCIKCGYETNPNDEREFFCSQCGAPVLNRCSNYNCQEILDEKAQYCKYCGATSTFKNYGIFDNISENPLIDADELPF